MVNVKQVSKKSMCGGLPRLTNCHSSILISYMNPFNQCVESMVIHTYCCIATFFENVDTSLSGRWLSIGGGGGGLRRREWGVLFGVSYELDTMA